MRHLQPAPRVRSRTLCAFSLVLTCAAALAGPAHADCTVKPDTSNDFSLECLLATRAAGVSSEPTLIEQTRYRSLVSEMSAVLALPVLEPADTVGFSGFHFSLDSSITSISNNADYFSGKNAGVRNVSGPALATLGVMLRKGVWMPVPPLPSVELGFGAANVLNSGIFALNGFLRLAIHEGYHKFPVPSIAFRAAVSRIAGTPQIDLTLISADMVISKAFGVAGTFTLEPYLGGGAIFSIARSQVIDTAPTIDLYRGPIPPAGMTGSPFDDPNARIVALNQKITFPNQKDIIRWRAFAGVQMHYAILAITAGFTFIGAGFDNGGNPATATAPLDLAPFQLQGNVSLGLRF